MGDRLVQRVKGLIATQQDVSGVRGRRGVPRKDSDVLHFDGVDSIDINRVGRLLSRHGIRAFLRSSDEGNRIDVYVPFARTRLLYIACACSWLVLLGLVAVRMGRASSHHSVPTGMLEES